MSINIKEFLKNILEAPEILELTASKTVYFLHANKPKPPYIEYEVVDEYGALHTEGIEKETTFVIQVDIFSKGDYTELEDVIKSKLINEGFERTSAVDLYEDDTNLYHKAMRFTYTG